MYYGRETDRQKQKKTDRQRQGEKKKERNSDQVTSFVLPH